MEPRQPAPDEWLRNAGLSMIPPWRRIIRRLPGAFRYWEGVDPLVTCFRGSVEIYPCRHGYLNRDRRWGTSCIVRTLERHVSGIEIRVHDGIYAAGTLFERFVEAGRKSLGNPRIEQDHVVEWLRSTTQVYARYNEKGHSAVFRIAVDDR